MLPSAHIGYMSAVLVIGEAGVAQERATELRMMGFPTWTATSEADLRWLLDQAWIRPAFAVVDVRADHHDRSEHVTTLAALAASAQLPAMLIGASDAEARRFQDVFARLPGDTDVQTIIDRLQGNTG
jgi:hypothetical protein